MPARPAVFRFRPRVTALPVAVAALGVAVGALAGHAYGLACAILGPLLGGAYLAAPAWRFAVVVDDDGLAVRHGAATRFRLAWSDIRELVCAPATKTCYVDGGDPSLSLLVPGPGAPAPYRIERREELYDLLVARVPADRRREVDSLDATAPTARTS